MDDVFALRVAATLLHFVWQGLILSLTAALLNRLLRNVSARARYSVNVGLLLAMAACLPLTFAVIDGSTADRSAMEMARSKFEVDTVFENRASEGSPFTGESAGPMVMQQQVGEANGKSASPPNGSLSEPNVLLEVRRESLDASAVGSLVGGDFFRTTTSLAPFVTWAYFTGVLFMMARLVVGLRGGQSLRRCSLPVEDAGLLAMVREQAARIGLSCVPVVAFCERISVPIVIGVMRPMILLPATLVSGLSPDQLQALVTHELSHIRRHDLLVNLLQRIVEAVLFFHPSVWFVSRRISMERENVADDAVLAAGWPAIRYADALVRMAELSSTLRAHGVTMQVAALAAAGSSSSEFKRRIIRLLDGSPSSQIRLSCSGIFAMALVTASLLMTPVVVQLAADDFPLDFSAVSTTEDAEERETVVGSDKPGRSDGATEGSDETAGPPRIVDGFVTGPGGAIAGAKATVTLSIVDEGTKNGYGLPIGKSVKTLEYTTDEMGRYKIVIPADLASNPLVRVRVNLTHPKYLGRLMGPLLMTDFDGKRIGNAQPYWLSRQMARQAIKQSRLRKAHHLTGRVLLPDGTPAVGAKVKTATKYRAYSWKHHSPDDYRASDEAITGSDGRFSIVIDESASFTAMMPGQAPLIVDDLKKRIQIANGDTPDDFRLPVANRIKGRVVTADGKPVSRAIVTARRDVKWNEFDMPLSFSISCAADELGHYELPPLPADQYQLSVSAQLDSDSRPEIYNEFMGRFRTTDQPDFATQPLGLVFVPMTTKLEQFFPLSTIDHQAVPMVTLHVKVEFPDGMPPTDRPPDVGISGTFNGQEWNGQYATADSSGLAILRAPVGLEWAFIKTGLARHQRHANSEVEIGQAIHFKSLDEDVSGITVIKPEFARLRVEVDQSGSSAATGGRLSISASYLRKGFREQSSDRQTVGLTGAMQSGRTEYQATALPDEPIVLTISEVKGGERRTIHQEQITLAPGENRVRKISLRDRKLDAEKEKVEAVQDRAIRFLLAQQHSDGSWSGEEDENRHAAGTTALVALALFDDGEQSDEAVQKAIQYLLKMVPTMTKEIALQTIFLHKLGKPGAALRRRNLQCLVDSQIKEGPDAGGWGYLNNALGARADGANTAYAILALTTVASRETTNSDKIPADVWRRAVTWLLSTQRDDGSWGYTLRGSQTSGTMTACGLAGLKALKARGEATPKADEAIEKAESWLKANWDTKANPDGTAWPLFYFEWTCRSLRDKPLLGERDWYSEVLKTVLQGEQSDGSISHPSSKVSPTITTAFALEILRSRPQEQISR